MLRHCLTLVLLLLPVTAFADWPQFKRDAARSGNAAEEALAFPMNRVVAVRFPAPIYASPAVVAGRVYVQDARGHLACIDAAANKVVWTTKIGGVSNMSSPAVADGKVYVGSSAGYLAIVNAADGKLLKKVLGDGGVIAAPALANGVYFSTLTGQLVKIDGDGAILWTFSGGPSVHVDFAVRGREILFFGLNEDANQGDFSCLLYRLEDEGNRVAVVSKSRSRDYPTGGPAFGPGKQCGYQHWGAEVGSNVVYRWDQDAKGVYEHTRGDLVDSRVTPSVRGSRFFFADRTGLVCIDCEPKCQVLWRSGGWPYYGPNGFHSSPALGKNALAAGCDDGRVYFFPIDYTGEDRNRIQKPLWTYATAGADRVNGAVSSSPAIAGGRVYFGGEDGILYGLGQGPEVPVVELGVTDRRPPPNANRPGLEWRTGGGDPGFSGVSPDTELRPPLQIRWRTRVWGSFKACMIVAAGQVFACSRSGTVTALDADTGEILWRTRDPNSNSWAAPTFAQGKLLTFRGNSAAPKGEGGAGIWCRDAATGQVLWRQEKPIPTGDYDFSAGPVVHEDRVLACWHAGQDVLEAAAYELATGKVIWTRQYPMLLPREGKGYIHVTQGCLGDGVWFCSISRAGRSDKLDPAQGHGGATLAIDPRNGDRLWTASGYFVATASRVCYRKGALVVFDGARQVGHALNPKTGAHLWTSSKIVSTQMNALTDAFLESKGTKDISGGSFCGYHVYANGYFWGTRGFSQSWLIARNADPQARPALAWTHPTLARSCPAPAPAYGRLYYAPNCEGMIYCFVNAK